MSRREVIQAGAGAAAAAALETAGAAAAPAPAVDVRVGVIGTGGRGTGLLGILLGMRGVAIPALCDIDAGRLANARDMAERARSVRPEGYGGDEHAYRAMLERDDLDAVVIATPWNWHTPMAVDAMEHGKVAAVEVPCALSIEECWKLVDTRQRTGVACMMLENWSYRRDNLAVLNMIRQGLLGDIVHCHCAHSHNCIDHWFFDTEGKDRWGARFLVEHNRDQYPTHSLGPVLSWLDINCGDVFESLTATATASKAINAYFTRRFGADHPSARRTYKQGDIVTSVVRTHRGRTVVINYDMQLPRPYDNRWMVQGTMGLYDEDRAVVCLEGRSPRSAEWEPFAPYQERYDHEWWRRMATEAEAAGHGGTDYLELKTFLDAVRGRTETPIDVIDSVTMSAVVALSEQSIARGGAPVRFPDFTRGKWRTRKPSFGMA